MLALMHLEIETSKSLNTPRTSLRKAEYTKAREKRIIVSYRNNKRTIISHTVIVNTPVLKEKYPRTHHISHKKMLS